MKYYLKLIIQKLIRFALLPFGLFPIRENRILFLSLEGGSRYEYSCNPKYFYRCLTKTCPGRFEPVWLFREPKKYAFLAENGAILAKHFTPRGLYYALTSRVVITNGGYLTWFPFRRGQIRINTWHGGGAYKKLENDAAGANAATKRRMDFLNRNTTLFLSSSEAFEKYVIRGAFRYTGEILSCGMPRNDVFFDERLQEYSEKVRRELSLPPDARLLLCAPTFRDGDFPAGKKLSAAQILACLTELTGETWILLSRAHVQAGSSLLTDLTEHCLDVSSYPDTQELLCAADMLITDYSSITWDYALTGRPLLLYTPDLTDYCRRRGFYVDVREWGFPLACSMEELLAALPDAAAGVSGSAGHLALLGSCERGQACEELLAWLEEKL